MSELTMGQKMLVTGIIGQELLGSCASGSCGLEEDPVI